MVINHSTPASTTSAPTLLTQLEAGFWLTRPHIAFSKVPMAAAGWAVGRGAEPTALWEALLLMALLAAMQTLMFVVNDLHDAAKDRITAPYLPLPRGLITPMGALLEAALLGVTFLGAAFVLAPSTLLFVLVLGTIPPALGTMAFYSRTKAAWYSPLLASSASASFVAWAWLLAGHRQPALFALVFAVASLHGVHANLRSQIYDIEGDPKAGTLTLAARLGPKRALLAAATVKIVELAGIVALVVIVGARWGALWLVPTLGCLVAALAQLPKAYAATRNRRDQTAALFVWVYLSFMTELAVLGAFEPLASLALGAFMYAWFHVTRNGYYRRLHGTAPPI